MNNFDNHLRGIDLFKDLSPHRFFFDVIDEVFDDFEIHVRLKQGDANLLEHVVHVLLGERCLPPHLFKDGREAIAE